MSVNLGKIREIAYLEGGISAIRLIQSSGYSHQDQISAIRGATELLFQALPANVSMVTVDGLNYGTDGGDPMDLFEVEAHLQDLKDEMGL